MASKITITNACLCFLSLLPLLSLVNPVPVSEPGSGDLAAYWSNSSPPRGFRSHVREGKEGIRWRSLRGSGGRPRRVMIGSKVPLCTYNECRGCRFKCRAEQVPVDASDPINSSYHYKCVCHR